MIKSFRCKDTQRLFETGKTKRFSAIKAAAERKLIMLKAAEALEDLKSPPGNRLEPLTGDREGHHSVHITSNGECASGGRMMVQKTLKLLIIIKENAL